MVNLKQKTEADLRFSSESEDNGFITLEGEKIIKFGFCCEEENKEIKITLVGEDASQTTIQIPKTGIYEFQVKEKNTDETLYIPFNIKEVIIPKNIKFTLEYVYISE